MRIRCPHCQNAIELVADATDVQPVTCPSCGSHLDLFDETATLQMGKSSLLQQFELLEKVGSGHFGDVWMARDTQLDRTVAVKIPRTQDFDPATVEVFFREARAAAQLRHPNIVSVHEVGRTGDKLYIVSDFVRGLTLAEQLELRRPSPREAAELCATIAEALHHAHEAGVVHRDLKPSNILLDEGGRPYLTDFGLAKREAGEITLTVAGRILGTPAYMSPEQARGEGHQADRRSDVYSLGVILYELLTGKRPFRGETRLLIYQVLHEDPLPPRRLNRAVPRDLETIALKAMAKESQRRYPTARAMADDMHRFLRGEPIQARRASRAERLWRWSRRNRAIAALAFLALLATVSAGALAWRSHTHAAAVAALVAAQRPATFRVEITTIPPQARMVFLPRSDETGEPLPERIVRPAGRSPVTVDLPPGDYLVVAEIEGVGFHEVYRHVPTAAEKRPGRHPHSRWRRLGNNTLGLDPVRILPEREVTAGMARFPGGTFTMGSSDLPNMREHERHVDPFFLDCTEVTVAACRAIDFGQNFGDAGESEPVRMIRFGQALSYAELVGKRLPTEAEYEFAATAGGTQDFPWGDSAEPLKEWTFGPAGEPAFDRTATQPPVFGLYSNVAEWTDSWVVPYPGERPLPSELLPLVRLSRVVRGGPWSVVNGRPEAAEVARGPRYRHTVDLDGLARGLGFRCARSVRPRFINN